MLYTYVEQLEIRFQEKYSASVHLLTLSNFEYTEPYRIVFAKPEYFLQTMIDNYCLTITHPFDNDTLNISSMSIAPGIAIRNNSLNYLSINLLPCTAKSA